MSEPRELRERPRRRPPGEAATRLDLQLRAMGARRPRDDEAKALRAVMRGNASAGQQRLAMIYVMAELCGVGSVPFVAGAADVSAFRAGSHAVGIAMAAIAEAVLMRFPGEGEGERIRDGDRDD